MHSNDDGVHSGIASTTFRGLVHEARGTFGFLPALKKPSLFFYWLRTARRAHAAMATAAVFLLLLLPPALRFGFEQQFPSKQIVSRNGAVTRSIPDGRVEPRVVGVVGLGWAIAAGVVGLLFWIHVPVAIVRAAVRSRHDEDEADALATDEPRRALTLYEEALALASDPDHELMLQKKILWMTRRLHVGGAARAAEENAPLPH